MGSEMCIRDRIELDLEVFDGDMDSFFDEEADAPEADEGEAEDAGEEAAASDKD